MTPCDGNSAGCVIEPAAGRPVVHIPTQHQVVRASLTSSGWIGLVQRRRQFGALTVSTWKVVRLPKAIIVDGSVLGHLPALALKGGHFETRWSKVGRASTTATPANPKTWFSKWDRAQAVFNQILWRGGR